VGELPPEVQASLLRFLQDGSFLPLGEVRSRHSDARVVAATNRDLEEAVRRGTFRADLYHRLNVIRLEVPPLRERPEDVALLLHHFLETAARGEGLPPPEVDPPVVTRLTAYPWPGNVRELQNLAKVLLMAAGRSGRVVPDHLPPRFRQPPRSVGTAPLQKVLEEAERAAIESAIAEAGGVLSRAARLLGISRQGLLKKKRRLGIGGD
jgi:NtrC-family two-component system response regulator AlgB